MMMPGLLTDFRLAVRGLLRHPAFTAIAIVTLSLGIGANTAVFTLVDGVLISPLSFDDPGALVSIQHEGRDGANALPISDGLYVLYSDQVASLAAIGMYAGTAVTLIGDGGPERIRAQAVTPSFFDVLKVQAVFGRTFTPEEGAPDGEPVVILSHGMWRTDFGGVPNVVGRALDIDGTLRRVVGVMPPDFGFPNRRARLWVPLVVDPARAPLASFGSNGVARMSEGHSIESVSTELAGLVGRLPELFPESGAVSFLQEVGLRSHVVPLKEAVVGDVTATLWILLGTVGFVLLIACANVANLLLVRAEGRQRELALRVAVGAGRMHVLRSFMSESLLLAALGGTLGAAVAAFAVRGSIGLVPADIPRAAEIGVNARVLAFTAMISFGSAVLFGFVPLLRFGSWDLAGQLREGAGRGATGSMSRHRSRNVLVVAQMSLALVLLVGSGLMFRSFRALRAVDPGFDTDRILTARITVPSGEVDGWEETAGFYRQLRDRLQSVPGVEVVGFAQQVPLAGGVDYYSIEVEDHPRTDDELPVLSYNNRTEVGYFEAIGIELLEGRTFRSGDGAEGARSVVVSHSFAEHWWPGRSPLGRRLRLGYTDEEWYTIVGVVADARYESLEGVPEEMAYWPATVGRANDPQPTRSMEVLMRASVDPLQLVAALRREVRALNPRIPVSSPTTMADRFAAATSRTSFTLTLLGAAAGIALLLGLVGIYGVISYVVSQRTREIGVRMALGATAPEVRGMIVRQGMAIAAAGVGIGLIAAAAMSTVMASLLYGVSATDPVTYAGAAASLTTVALAASWFPAVRAAGVDPSRALRSD
jgi:putative ABC transport system permease protein